MAPFRRISPTSRLTVALGRLERRRIDPLRGSLGDAALFRISAEGGPVMPATKVDISRGERRHLWPQFLPDGRRFIFYVQNAVAADNGVYVGSIDSVEKTLVLHSAANAGVRRLRASVVRAVRQPDDSGLRRQDRRR